MGSACATAALCVPEAFGELGLAGEVRQVGQTEARLKEAAKLGFTQAFLPAGRRKGGPGEAADLGDILIARPAR